MTAPEHARASLPFGSEFSPSQIDLRQTLEMIERHEGDQAVLQAAILATYFAGHGGSGPGADKNRRTLAMNLRLGLKAYAIIDDTARFTPFGRRLFDLRTDEKALYETLAADG